jgi:uncharacterized protein YkwD
MVTRQQAARWGLLSKSQRALALGLLVALSACSSPIGHTPAPAAFPGYQVQQLIQERPWLVRPGDTYRDVVVNLPSLSPQVPKLEPYAEAALLWQVNEIRQQNGLEPLTLQAIAIHIARTHTKFMLELGRLTYYSQEGGQLAAVRLRKTGLSFRNVAELIRRIPSVGPAKEVAYNILYGGPQGWMVNPVDKEALLRPYYSQTAVGIWRASDGTIWATMELIEP